SMKITDLLRKDGIALGVDAADQNAAIDKLIELHSKVGNLKDAEEFKKAIREAIKAKAPAVIECEIDSDDKVFPMVPAGKANIEVFDEQDLKRRQKQ
ncbi:MAG: hypothetical protein IJ239_06745, partial [Eubacterium sp.]|nr:hypothetical protein [Eubacterium sp.]